MSVTIVVFAALLLANAICKNGTSIYYLVGESYKVTLVGAIVPLVMGLYWKRASTQGAILSVALGIGVWIGFMVFGLSEAFPGQLAGLIAAFAGMIVGSLAPQVLKNRHEPHKTALSV
jgi:Na+/proline symporter